MLEKHYISGELLMSNKTKEKKCSIVHAYATSEEYEIIHRKAMADKRSISSFVIKRALE